MTNPGIDIYIQSNTFLTFCVKNIKRFPCDVILENFRFSQLYILSAVIFL